MGIARLLAKGWLLFCIIAGGHALHLALASGMDLASALPAIGICVILFSAMGLLFVGGFGVSGGLPGTPLVTWLRPHHFLPGFNEIVFMIFVVLSFALQVAVAANAMTLPAVQALEAAVDFAVPGQHALVRALEACNVDGGRVLTSSFTWLLAIVYLASALSRLKLQAGVIRLEMMGKPEILGPSMRALLFGIVAVIGIQFLYLGSAFPLLGCSAYADITGALLMSLAPLMLAYVIVAALASLLAAAPEA
jgi:hypothetical protein